MSAYLYVSQHDLTLLKEAVEKLRDSLDATSEMHAREVLRSIDMLLADMEEQTQAVRQAYAKQPWKKEPSRWND